MKIPDGKVEEKETKVFPCGFCNFTKYRSLDRIIEFLQQLQLILAAITKDLNQNSILGSRIKTLKGRDNSMSETNTVTLLSNVETEKKKQKDEEIKLMNMVSKNYQNVKGKVKDVLPFPAIQTDPVKMDSIGTTKEQNKQLLLVETPNSKTKRRCNSSGQPKKITTIQWIRWYVNQS